MAARKKLNQAYFNGSLVIAGVAGLLTQSWLVFGAAVGGLLLMNIHNKNIR